MKGVIKKDLMFILSKTIDILQTNENTDLEQLKTLSDHAIEDVAVHKDIDLVSLTVLIYSIYKIYPDINEERRQDLVAELKRGYQQLQQNNLGRYNLSIKSLYNLIHESNDKIKTHLNDVMHAARIKKSAALLRKGLSIGQAAGIMGLSNWDLQQYVGRTNDQEHHNDKVGPIQRVKDALAIFGVS